ncbi:MAG TPA: GNAT family N-acetyltransferase, partial [Clostridia bacterium]|nr:GNAT family N-acetyltransferase [Clostridia bacterium]
DTSTKYEIRWYEQKDIGQFYGQWFSHALMPQFHPQHPDVLAVCAIDKGEIVGMAACQADTDMMWQIGVDVKKEYRGKRIGTVLSALLKEEILRRGKIPYYGTLEANIYSQRIAYEIGFYPSWIECRMLKKVK